MAQRRDSAGQMIKLGWMMHVLAMLCGSGVSGHDRSTQACQSMYPGPDRTQLYAQDVLLMRAGYECGRGLARMRG